MMRKGNSYESQNSLQPSQPFLSDPMPLRVVRSRLTGFSPTTDYDDQTFIIRSKDTNSFTCLVDSTQAGSVVTDDAGFFIKFGPTYTKPSTISEITSVTLDGVELEILSESEINSLAYRGGGNRYMIDGQYGMVPNPFDTKVPISDSIPRWRDRTRMGGRRRQRLR